MNLAGVQPAWRSAARAATGRDASPRKIVSVNTADQGGGAERVAWELFQGYRRRGVESWLLVGDKKSADPHVMPFFLSPHLDYRPYGRRWSTARRAVLKWLNRTIGLDDFEFPYAHHLLDITGSRPDLVHCHNLHGGYFDLRALPALSRRVPVVVTLHDGWHLGTAMSRSDGTAPSSSAAPAPSRLQRGIARWNQRRRANILRRCRLYVAAPSRWLLNRVPDSPLGPAVLESRVIPNGIDLTRFCPRAKREVRASLPLPREGHLVVFAAWRARSNPFKDGATIAEAVQRLGRLELREPVQFVVIGEAAPAERIGQVVLQYLPFVEQAELVRYFQAADVYVHAAREEVFGLVLAEAMACGTPVVASAVGGIPEVVRDQHVGFLTPPGDAAALAHQVARLLGNASLRAAMADAALRHARTHFNGERMISAYLNWFQEIGV